VKVADVLRTVDHNVSIVRENSYIAIVNPRLGWVKVDKPRKRQTICLVVLVHEGERVKVYIAMEVHAWPV
jgi:hypothetical protein